MLTEDNRMKLLELLKNMGIDPNYVSRDGATNDGYRTFVFEPGKRQEDGSRLTRFVPWSHRQLDMIFENGELFEPWFAESEHDIDPELSVITAEELVANFSEYGCKVEIVSPHAFGGIHPTPGNPVEFNVMLRFVADV